MSQLTLRLLGPPRLERGPPGGKGEPLEFDTRKIIALVAYLAVTGKPHTRESLITLLWPELDPSRARAVLRRNLSLLRKALDGEWLVVDREIVDLNPETDVWIDVDQFRSLLQVCKEHDHPEVSVCPDCLRALTEAVELYQGDFLAGFTLRDSVNFDEFQFFQTEELRRQLASALKRLVQGHSAQGAYETAIPYARRRLALDPLHEPAHRRLMDLYAQAGQRSAALRQYEECARVLEEELGLLPAEETTSLYERIRTGVVEGERPLTPRHNLPAQATPFIGREVELAEIEARLDDPDCRLLTLVGPGGSGKTRLALEAAAAQLDNFQHGVFFVSLAPLRSVDRIVPTVAQAVGFSFYGGREPEQQLLDYLREKRMLIIMDNYEHLLEGTGLVTDALKTAPGVKVLATSRARLNVGGEHRFQIGGMDVPDAETGEDGAGYSAVRLFLQGARRAQAGFEPSAGDLHHISRACRLVDGMPLAIRLAAAWVAMLSPEEIANQITGDIGQSLDLLTTERHDVSERQRSVRAVFDHSWNLLAEREREVFQELSVFRGGFTREAAQEVTGASLRDLMALVDRSLLHRAPTGRYEIHELLRQYAEEKLDQEPAAGETARDRHSAHYTAALAQWEADLKGSRYTTALAEMNVEIENARAAWDWAAEQGQVVRLDRALDGLSEFYWAHYRVYEGEAACRTAASKLAAMASGDGLRVLARILARQADFRGAPLGRAEEPINQLLQQSLAILEGLESAGQDIRAEKAFVLLCMGQAAQSLDSDYEKAQSLLEQSLALYRAVGDRWGTALLLNRLAWGNEWLGAYDEAKRRAKESLAVARASDNPAIIASSLMTLGRTTLTLGQLEEAERSLRESVALHRETAGRGNIAYGLWEAGRALVRLGKIDEARSLLEESRAIFDDLGIHWGIAQSNAWLGYTEMHLGQYERAHAQAQMGLGIFQEYGPQWGIGFSLFALGSVALAEAVYAEAWQLLQESAAVYREIGLRDHLGQALAVLGYATRGLGHPPQAKRHLSEALQFYTETGAFFPLMYGLPAVALLLADRGEVERAVEVYALASRYPFVANSKWFEDVAGKHVAAAAATLLPEVVAAAQERGRARDLDATVVELLEELASS